MDPPGIEPGTFRCKRNILPLDYGPENNKQDSNLQLFRYKIMLYYADELRAQLLIVKCMSMDS